MSEKIADQLPTETEGVRDATSTEVVELADGDSFELEIAPSGNASAMRSCACSPTTARSRADALGSRRLDRDRPGDEPRRPRRHRALARPPAREPLRRDARDAGADPGRRDVHLRGAAPRPGRLLVPPAHPRGLRAGARPVREHPRRPRGARTTGRPPTASSSSRSTTSSSRTARIAPFSASETTHVAMGRFGNVMLVAGEPDLSLTARRGEVVRLYLTNTANTRVFNVALPGARVKLVGGDSGRYEREEIVEEVLDRAVRARRRRRPLRRARRARARAPDARAHVPARRDHAWRRVPSSGCRRGLRRSCGRTRTWPPSASGSSLSRRGAGQDPLLRRGDGARRSPRGRPPTSARCTPR